MNVKLHCSIFVSDESQLKIPGSQSFIWLCSNFPDFLKDLFIFPVTKIEETSHLQLLPKYQDNLHQFSCHRWFFDMKNKLLGRETQGPRMENRTNFRVENLDIRKARIWGYKKYFVINCKLCFTKGEKSKSPNGGSIFQDFIYLFTF